MWQSIKQICGDKLGASDGEIGQVKDFYFDGLHWAVRYPLIARQPCARRTRSIPQTQCV